MYAFLDAFFLFFHAALVVFVLTGWLWRRTRRLHLVVMTLVCFSWAGLGYFYGFGYCPSTDWHWRIKARRGETDLPGSFITYCLNQLSGQDWNDLFVGYTVVAIGMVVLVASAVLNARDWRKQARDGFPMER